MATSVARVTEIIASSPQSFDDAFQGNATEDESLLKAGIKRANKTLKGVQSAWIKDQKVSIKNGKIVDYRVNIKVTFVLMD